MSVEYKSLNEILNTVKGQLDTVVSESVDQIVLFDGTLQQAINDHFGPGTKPGIKSIIFVAQTDISPESMAGSGLALRDGILIDIYPVIRSSGRSRYEGDREALNDLSDLIWHEAFHHTNTRDEFKSRIGSMQSQARVRQATGDGVLAHLVRFLCIPKRS